jgi:bifunctional non-homologous end joining protein LigD
VGYPAQLRVIGSQQVLVIHHLGLYGPARTASTELLAALAGYDSIVDKLAAYRGKRDASRTPEPVPAEEPAAAHDGELTFVVQEHHARRLHWDFRLERDGVLVSWALPKGVPDDPAVNHLAVHTEDHPLEYGGFEGTIPRGEYGAGAVTIWDSGTYEPVKWTGREVKVNLHGNRVSGGYVLFQTGGKNWMIHREKLALPDDIKPMLATPGRPAGLDGWALEMKWDGVRALAYIEGGRTRLVSRTGKDITANYPELAAIGSGIKQALVDGEIVAFGPDGWPDFEALQPRIHATPAQAARLAAVTPVAYVAFDLLQVDGRPLADRPYTDRRELLQALPHHDGFQVPPSFLAADFDALLATAVEHGLEGIVAKRADSVYEPGARTGMWRKIKNVSRQEVVVGGWKPGKGNRLGKIGSLLIGVYDESGQLRYCGHVGTGFTEQTLSMLGERLTPLKRRTSPFDEEVPAEYARTAVWTEPRVVVEVEFESWTHAGRMRAPAYKGLRDDKEPTQVIRET